MKWVEPREAARARSGLFRKPKLLFFAFLSGFLIGALAFTVTTAVTVRLTKGIWQWRLSLLIGVFAGLGFGFSSGFDFLKRYPVLQQEINLNEQGFWIRGTKEYSMRYDQIRGYSIIHKVSGKDIVRTLLLYPKEEEGLFSISLPESISDRDVHSLISNQIPFVTIVDERALKKP
jgi:hypothetical protein